MNSFFRGDVRVPTWSWGMLTSLLLSLSFLWVPGGPAFAQFSADTRLLEPEAGTGHEAKPAVTAARHMVATANPLASAAGLEILREGGSAIDAAIAVQMVLTLVEPQSSGLGGGAFLVLYDAASGAVATIDGREIAPRAAVAGRFLGADGAPRPFGEIVASPASVGVPGVLRALEAAHAKGGRLPWARLMQPAIALAENGFVVSSRLATLLAIQGKAYFDPAGLALYFQADGRAIATGSVLRNRELAESLRAIAVGGAAAFYEGPLAGKMLAALAARGSSDMTAADLAGYAAKERPALCFAHSSRRVCGMGPPSSGGITLAMIFALAGNGAGEGGAGAGPAAAADVFRDRLDAIRRLIEAEKLAYADRDRYVADPDFVPVPEGLLDAGYLAGRAGLIDIARPMAQAVAGEPPASGKGRPGVDGTQERPGTSHISIVDGEGNAVAMTTSIQTAFGSGITAGGFLLNSELTDFAFRPVDETGQPVANRVEGGKRPRSSMSPTIVLDGQGRLEAVLGSPGGNRIILYTAKALACLIDWGCPVELAGGLVNFGSRNGPAEVEADDRDGDALARALEAGGAKVVRVDMTSGLAIIRRRGGELEGAADPRREGVVLGD